ncbi:MAG TPA: hypothetical protein DCZ95_12380 [Verrucomicrobia bacterium]|nr:MAG: hypothetical protein A2X46_14425 [Lentisphaerae bacterium GWF2_57_35]HBA84882.1 hypothetical protein [Verrucomicrobiota bacterium]
MSKKPEPPKEPQAPAYFVQYAALWCLMLAFFVVLLSMGHERTADFKAGVGAIRDAFGLKGGLGMMAFWRKSTSGLGDNNPTAIRKKKEEEGDIVGNFKGMLWKEGLSSVDILQTQFDDRGISITLSTPLRFASKSAVLDREMRSFLNRIGTIFFAMPDTVITIGCLTDDGADNDDLLRAAERSTAITRYFIDECMIPGTRLDAVGYSHHTYLQGLNSNQWSQAVIFSIRKLKEERAGGRSSAMPI